MKTKKKKICIDFDGPIYLLPKGWNNGETYDNPTPKAKWAMKTPTGAGYKVITFCIRPTEHDIHQLGIARARHEQVNVIHVSEADKNRPIIGKPVEWSEIVLRDKFFPNPKDRRNL